MFLVVLQISIKFSQLQVELPMFDSPVCLFDLSINVVYDTLAQEWWGDWKETVFSETPSMCPVLWLTIR